MGIATLDGNRNGIAKAAANHAGGPDAMGLGGEMDDALDHGLGRWAETTKRFQGKRIHCEPTLLGKGSVVLELALLRSLGGAEGLLSNTVVGGGTGMSNHDVNQHIVDAHDEVEVGALTNRETDVVGLHHGCSTDAANPGGDDLDHMVVAQCDSSSPHVFAGEEVPWIASKAKATRASSRELVHWRQA